MQTLFSFVSKLVRNFTERLIIGRSPQQSDVYNRSANHNTILCNLNHCAISRKARSTHVLPLSPCVCHDLLQPPPLLLGLRVHVPARPLLAVVPAQLAGGAQPQVGVQGYQPQTTVGQLDRVVTAWKGNISYISYILSTMDGRTVVPFRDKKEQPFGHPLCLCHPLCL